MQLDSAVIELLRLDTARTSVSSAGGGGCSSASTSKITTTLDDGTEKRFFMKSGSGKDSEVMFAGEHASLKAIHDAVPTLCPQSFGHGTFASDPSIHFLVTDFLDLSPRSSSSSSSQSLACKLATLHTTPAPIPPNHSTPQFGFPVPTCCGDTPQPNPYASSWSDFYAQNRLLFILSQSQKSHGTQDVHFARLVEETANVVVPRLLSASHLNNGKGVVPVVVHGDLWSGNASSGILPGFGEPQQVVYDPSAVYAHSEYELGIMKMFGGFGKKFMDEYHAKVPRTEPVEEYEDRVALYELFHHLNHYAMFGGGYKGGAKRIMEELIAKYGDEGGGK